MPITLDVCKEQTWQTMSGLEALENGRRVKFSHDKLTGATFITAQIEGNEIVYSILLSKSETDLSRKKVEGRFRDELLKK